MGLEDVRAHGTQQKVVHEKCVDRGTSLLEGYQRDRETLARMPQNHSWERLGWRCWDSHYWFSCLPGAGGQSGQPGGVRQCGFASWQIEVSSRLPSCQGSFLLERRVQR